MDVANNDEGGPETKLFAASPMWRRDQALPLILSACKLLEGDLTEDQKQNVTQILFNATRLYLDAQDDLRPGCRSVFLRLFLPFKTPVHRRELGAYTEEAFALANQLVEDPSRAPAIFQAQDGLSRRD